jgi:hypothetical protein
MNSNRIDAGKVPNGTGAALDFAVLRAKTMMNGREVRLRTRFGGGTLASPAPAVN